MDKASIIGYAAATICALSMVPQVVKTHITRKTGDISLWAFAALSCGLFLWLVYGVLIMKVPIIAGNSIGLTFCLYLVFMKKKYG